MLCYFSNSNFADTDECLIVSHCHVNATCNNTEGSFTCTCDSGYFGDGVSCNGMRLTRVNTVIMDKTSIKLKSNILCCFLISNFVDTDECSTLSPCNAYATCNKTKDKTMLRNSISLYNVLFFNFNQTL